MVNSTRRRRGNMGSIRRSNSPVKPAPHPQFFKIITSSAVEHGKLRIPRKFVNTFGKNLANIVFLRVPNGAVWKMELINSDGDVWLCNGWKEFTDYYSIRFGHLLVFRYDGNSNFHVIIFDVSASEIEYPFSPTHGGKSNTNLKTKAEYVELDDSVEILEDFPTYQTERVEIPKRNGIMKDDVVDDRPTCQMRTEQKCKMDVKPLCLTRKIKKEFVEGMSIPGRHVQFQIPNKKQSATSADKFRALLRASDFKSKYPFFVIYMQPSHVTTKYVLNLPMDFVRKYFSVNRKNVILQVSDGKTWSVKCYCGAVRKQSLRWISFVRDNNLKKGDVCVFELIKKGVEPWLKVTIFRA